jgi:hypothetical protein
VFSAVAATWSAAAMDYVVATIVASAVFCVAVAELGVNMVSAVTATVSAEIPAEMAASVATVMLRLEPIIAYNVASALLRDFAVC